MPHDLITLSPGERLTLAGKTSPRLDMPRVEAVTAWRRGEVILEKTTLVDAVAEMNRYDTRQLVIDDAAIGGLRVSGIYKTGDSMGFARAVAAVHGIEIARHGALIHLRESGPVVYR